MRQLVLTPRFKRAYRQFTRRDKKRQQEVDEALRQMEADLFQARLSTHKLSGPLSGLWASSCGNDCRILFALERDPESGAEVILLLDLGTHDELY